jgi:hypothetical protein
MFFSYSFQFLHRIKATNIKSFLTTTNSMKQSNFWETYNPSATQQTTFLLHNLKFHYGVQKIPPLGPIVSHINPIHALSSYFFGTYLNIILPLA